MNLPATPASPAAVPPAGAEPALPKLAVGLALLTFLVFLPVVSMNWVNYDDDVFVTANPKVAAGLTWEGIQWAFTSADIDYWRPISWLSHMVDIELFGPVAGYHHLTNLVIHIAGTVMLLLALHRLTGALWPSAMVAALFAWHPLHVESVAWIAERKDVLCGFFWFYTLWAYAGYVREPTPRNYLRVFFGFVLGVMSKPMIVTLPCALLLLDWWPLRRFEGVAGWRALARTSGQLLKEKVPLFAVVVVLCVSTVFSQHRVGALSDFGHLPLAARLPTVLAAYGTYLAQTFWPAGLCVLYPLPKTVPLWQWAGSASLLAAVTVGCLAWGRRLPCLPVGWFWFLGILVPVIGLVQVGEQGHADRYTYIPLVGVFIMLVWPVVACAERNARLARALPWLAAAVLVACAVASLRQVRHWENSITIFTRAATVTKDNVTAMNNIAAELRAIGQIKESVVWLEKSIAIRAGQGQLYNLALSHRDLGDMLKAQYYAYHAFKLDPRGKVATTMYEMLDAMAREQPDKPGTWKLLAVADQVRGDDEATMRHLAEVIRTDAQDVGARIDRSAFLARRGRETEAITLLQEALTLAPTNTMARGNLAALLVKQGRHAEGLPHYEAALKATPDNPDLRHNYALLLSRTHKVPEARREFEAILKSHPKHVPAHQQLAWLLATRTECRNGPEALRLAKAAAELTPAPTPLQLDVLAAAHAATGDFDTAVTLATTGLNLARTAKLTQLEDAMRDRLRLYRDRLPYTAD